MSDEALEQAPVETDKPSVEPADTTDWEQQYKALQPEYTRNQQALKDAQSVWEDEQALIARIGEKFPHLIAEEEPVEDDEDDSYDEPEHLTKQEFQAWQTEQQTAAQQKANEEQFTADFNRFVGDRELDQYGDAALKSGTYKDPAELEAAINGYFEYLDSLSGGKRKRKTTAPLAGGKVATGVPDYSDMSREAAVEAMTERARALDTQM